MANGVAQVISTMWTGPGAAETSTFQLWSRTALAGSPSLAAKSVAKRVVLSSRERAGRVAGSMRFTYLPV